MQDIFINDPRQTSAKEIAQRQTIIKKTGRRWYQFLADLFIKSMLVAVLLAVDFTLFARAGSYNLFSASHAIALEAVYIYAIIAAVSFALILVTSFSVYLQNVVVSAVAAILLWAVFNQFALFDYRSILSAYLGILQGTFAFVINDYSHFILMLLVFLLTYMFMGVASRATQAWTLGTGALILLALLSDAYFAPQKQPLKDMPAIENLFAPTEQDRNLVFIALTQAPSYNQLKALGKISASVEIQHAAANMLGFYQQNNFTYYPQSYIPYPNMSFYQVSNDNMHFYNMAEILNPEQDKGVRDLLMSNIYTTQYWDFDQIGLGKLYLSRNKIFDTFHNNKYNIYVYEGRGIELCSSDNILSVNRCIGQRSLPIDLENKRFTLPQKVSLLMAEWLESTQLVPHVDTLFNMAAAVNPNVSKLNFSASGLYSLDSFAQLDRLTQDISRDKGSGLYVLLMEMPSDSFMYDSNCRLKPLTEWVKADNNSINIKTRQIALAEQTNCLYGQLEKFIQELRRQKILDHTAIVIASLNTPIADTWINGNDIFRTLHLGIRTNLAIYDPLKEQEDIDYSFCSTSQLLYKYLYHGVDCNDIHTLNVPQRVKEQIQQKVISSQIPPAESEQALQYFKSWYASWAKANNVENDIDDEVIPLETHDEVIQTVPVAVAEELPPEAPAVPLSEVSAAAATEDDAAAEQSKTSEESAAPTETKPSDASAETLAEVQTAPEQDTTAAAQETAESQPTKSQSETPAAEPSETPAEPQINMEVKVIEQTESVNDVIPPFLFGEDETNPIEETGVNGEE